MSSKSKMGAKTKVVVENKKQPQISAAETIKMLENNVNFLANKAAQYEKQISILADSIDKLDQVIMIINKRTMAILKAGEKGHISEAAVNNIIIEANSKELEDKIKFLVEQKALIPNQEGAVDGESFIVGREVLIETGDVVNPRIQWAMPSLNADLQKLFLGKKPGEMVLEEGSDKSIEITEIYQINQKDQEKTFEEEKA